MKYLKAIIAIFLLVCLDQYSKYIVVQKLAMYDYHPILGDVFGLFYLENKGMAWGMFQNQQIIFLIFTVIILVAMGYCFVKLSNDMKFLPIRICITFISAGAIGNMIDRIIHGDVLFQGSVVDFLYIKAIDFPVFNFADIYVTCFVAVLVLLLLFRYKEDDFNGVLFPKKNGTDALDNKSSDKNSSEMVQTDSNQDTDSYQTDADSELDGTVSQKKVSIEQLFDDEKEEDE